MSTEALTKPSLRDKKPYGDSDTYHKNLGSILPTLPTLRDKKPYTKSLVVILPARVETILNFYILPVATATPSFSLTKRKKIVPKIDVTNTIIMLAFISGDKSYFRGFKTSNNALKNSLTMKIILEDSNTINLKLSSGKIESENNISYSKIQTCGGRVEEQLSTSIRIIGEHINFLNKIYETCVRDINKTEVILKWLLSIVCGPLDILYYPKFYNEDCLPGVTTAASRFMVHNKAPDYIDEKMLSIFLNILSTRAEDLLPDCTAYQNITDNILNKMKRSHREVYLVFAPNIKSIAEQIREHYHTKIQKYKDNDGLIDITEYINIPSENNQELMYKLACQKIIFNSESIEGIQANVDNILADYVKRNNIVMEGAFSYSVKSLESLAEEMQKDAEVYKKDTSNVYWKAMVNYNIKIGFDIFREALLQIFTADKYKEMGYSVNFNKKQVKKLYKIPSYEEGLRVYNVGKEPRTTIAINANGTIGISGPNERECENVFDDFVKIVEQHRTEVDAVHFEYDAATEETIPEGLSLDMIGSVINSKSAVYTSPALELSQLDLINNHINSSFQTGLITSF